MEKPEGASEEMKLSESVGLQPGFIEWENVSGVWGLRTTIFDFEWGMDVEYGIEGWGELFR